MTDWKIRIKRGSLSRRILFISVLILVLPLLAHSVFQYTHEYKQTLKEWQEDLDIMAQERALLAEVLIEMGGTLDPVLTVVPFTHPATVSILDAPRAPQKNFLQATAPIEGSGQFVQISMDKRSIEGLHLEMYYMRFLSLLFFVVVVGGAAVYLFTRRVSKPLNQLCETMQRVSEGERQARYQPDRFGFEINDLGMQFNQTLNALQSAEMATEELRIGHEIQRGLLPTEIPGVEGVKIETAFHAAKEVNGDFYDLLRLENGKLLLAVCDTAGKGISACLFSLGLRSSLRTLAMEGNPLAEIVEKANRLYCLDAESTSMFSTLWIGLYDPASKVLQYCSQGHPPAFLNGRELSTGGAAMGTELEVNVQEVVLESGDQLLLYTDGVVEAHNEKHQLFGKERLQNLLGSSVEQIVREVKRFAGNAPQHDDITLVSLQVR